MKKLLKLISNKLVITAFSLFLQIVVIALLATVLSAISVWIYVTFLIITFFVCVFIIGKDINPAYKLAWIVPILAFPITGGLMFLMIGRQPKLRRKHSEKLETIMDETAVLLEPETSCADLLHDEDSVKLSRYIQRFTSYPVYENTQTRYYPYGQDFADALLAELSKAQKFIFMEFFIIDDGKLWSRVLDVLQRKAADGVEVRLIYDDMGCLFTLPRGYSKKLTAMGIRTHVFNKIAPTFNLRLNNRTHRKIVVIDGEVGFTGGINLADEYTNEIVKYGYWKDTGIMIKGDAVRSFTVMFLRFWYMLEKERDDASKFLPELPRIKSSGYVQPLSGGPGKNVQAIENALMQIINNADRYVYINTPYLILDNEFTTSLCLAAKSGVDVRITMPYVPDKKTVFMMSRSFYPILLRAGVKIYEYLPGFIHAKSVLCDDRIAYVGSCNLDYRSFYLHYECGAVLYGCDSIADMKADYERTLGCCREITYEMANDVSPVTRAARSLLRLFAPLL